MSFFNGTEIPGLGVNVTLAPVDKHFNPESENAQSGIAVEEAMSQFPGGGGGTGDYVLTEEDKEEIANIVLSNFTDVAEVGQ